MRFVLAITLILSVVVPAVVAAQDTDRAKERLEAMRALRDRPYGSTGTGSILGTSGIDSAFGTPGPITSGVGRGTAVEAGGPDSSVLPASHRGLTDLTPFGRLQP